MTKRTTTSFIIATLAMTVFIACKVTKDNSPKPLSPKDFHDDQKCYHNGKLSTSERLKIYPFNSQDKIKIISFLSSLGMTPIVNDTISSSQIIDQITLTTAQTDNLTDILYNYNYSKKTNVINETEYGCYNPRHAIIFLDKTDKVLSYIEVCFECEQIKTFLPKESIGHFCDGKYELLKNFFISIGIKHFL